MLEIYLLSSLAMHEVKNPGGLSLFASGCLNHAKNRSYLFGNFFCIKHFSNLALKVIFKGLRRQNNFVRHLLT